MLQNENKVLKVLYDFLLQIPVTKGRTVTCRFYTNAVLRKMMDLTKVVAPKQDFSTSDSTRKTNYRFPY